MKVERLLGQGALTGLPNLDKLRMSSLYISGSHTMGAKIHSGKGNSPDRRLRPPNSC